MSGISAALPEGVANRRYPRWLLSIPLLFTLLGCAEEAPPEAPLRPVRTQILNEADPVSEQRLPGRLEAGANRRLSFRVAGRLAALEVGEGERVAAGQRLAALDDDDFELKRDQARASLAAATAAMANAEAEWQRARRLYEAGSLAARDLDAARAQAESARAQRDSAADALALAERQKGFAELTAPGDCRVARRLAEVGENLVAGQPVLVMACGDDLEVRAALPEEMLGRLAPGDTVRVHLPLHDVSLPGRVREIGLPVDPRQATWPLAATLDVREPGLRERLRPGMAAELSLPGDSTAAGIWVPMVAVQRDAQGAYVYIAEPTDTGVPPRDEPAGEREARIRRVAVELGGRHGERLEVREGLEAGMALVTAGMSRLDEGQRVRLLDRPPEGEGEEATP